MPTPASNPRPLPAIDAEDADWHQAAKEGFLAAYDDQDAIYDEL